MKGFLKVHPIGFNFLNVHPIVEFYIPYQDVGSDINPHLYIVAAGLLCATLLAVVVAVVSTYRAAGNARATVAVLLPRAFLGMGEQQVHEVDNKQNTSSIVDFGKHENTTGGELGRLPCEWDGVAQQERCPDLGPGVLDDVVAGEPASGRRNVFVFGDSTDRLWVIGTCNGVLSGKEGECALHISSPKTRQAPQNIRTWDVEGHRRQHRHHHQDHQTAASAAGLTENGGCCSNDGACCASDRQLTAAPVCRTHKGYFGQTHVFWARGVENYNLPGAPKDPPGKARWSVRRFNRFVQANMPGVPTVAVFQLNYWRINAVRRCRLTSG